MYLFTRSVRLGGGDLVGQMSWVAAITEQVRNVTGRDTSAWASVLSPDAGTVSWTLWVEHLGDLEEGADKLMASSDYLDAVVTGQAHLDGPVTDGLRSLVHNAPDLSGEPPNYASVASAVAAPGRLGDAIAGGIEIADLATRLTGQTTMFLVNSTGPYGGCSWITGSPDIDTVEHGEVALASDPAWVQLIDRVGTAYNNDASQALYRRIV